MTVANPFIGQLMAHILEGSQIPKVQVERAVGPILGFFLADVLSATLCNDERLSGQYRVLCPEFPLLKPVSLQSSNIDWLLYNETRQELVFLELKTANRSFSADQAVVYLQKKLQVMDQGAGFLADDLKKIEAASSEKDKYAFVQQMLAARFPGGIEAMSGCRSAQVIYLVPAPLKLEAPHLHRMDKVLAFSDLADDIESPFAQEWKAICHALRQLDASTQPLVLKSVPNSGAPENYRGRADFGRIQALCREHGGKMVVGFMGGESALREATTDYLQGRTYKLDFVEGGQGYKLQANWISGDRFLETLPCPKDNPV